MKSKKSGKSHHVQAAPPKEIVLPFFKRHRKQMNGDEESRLVRIFYSTGHHRHPVHYWRLIRKRNTTHK